MDLGTWVRGMWMLGLVGWIVLNGQSHAADITIQVGKDTIDFMAGNELFCTYQISTKFSKPIVWPLKAPGGINVTRAWPMEPALPGGTTDHVHQKSVWFCWGDLIPEGIEIKDKVKGVKGVDFWAEAKGHGNIVCTKVGEAKTDRWRGSLPTHNEWRMADGTKIMDEDRTLFVYDFGKARLLVFDITMTASVCPITFGDTKEGAMGVRVHDQIVATAKGKGKIQNAEGKICTNDSNGGDCWGVISPWCDYSGPIDGKLVGVAILCDPKNPHPSVWHTRGYGLHAANPFGRGGARFPAMEGRTDLVRLEKGQSIHFRYGVLVHEGDADSGRVADYYLRFIQLREMEK